jgi:pimeloyl-ACP methyl ester carboxylesterase
MEAIRVGDLLVHVWPAARSDAPYAVAAHGITANGLSWARVADLLDGEVSLVAPDLRGRAGSRDAAGPYGLARHADDLVAVLDELGVPDALFVGHSMGAFVATRAAVRHPARTTGVVLVDGGLGFPPPPGTDLDALLTAVLGPAMARLEMEFPTRDAYRQYWQAHPAFAGEWPPWVDAYIQHDLVGTGPFRSSCVAEAVRVDGTQMLGDPAAHAAIHALPAPGVLIYAERGLLDEAPGAYTEQRLAGLEIPAVLVPGTNHYSILVSDAGAKVIADHIRAQSRVAFRR